jgi:arylsulfatase A-like enzyme
VHKGDHLTWQPGWHALDEEDVTIAEALQANKYTTAFVTDVYHMFKPTGNFHRGFDSWQWIRGQEQDRYLTGPREDVDFTPYVRGNAYQRRRFQGLEQYLLNVSRRRNEEDYFVAQVMRTAADWISDNVGNLPFFMWVDCFDPHEPWDPPREFADIYCPNYKGRDPIVGAKSVADLPPEEFERMKALYAGEVTLVDKWIGHLLDRLEECGLKEDTIVAFTSDHGTLLGEDGHIHKSHHMLIQPEVRLPFIVRHPDKQFAGKRVEQLVHAPDFMPTLLGLLGVDAPDRVTGRNIWPLVTGEADSIHDYVVTAYTYYASIRNEKWNYIIRYAEHERAPDMPPRLFDVKNDPQERKNVVDSNPSVAAEIQARLDEYIKERSCP